MKENKQSRPKVRQPTPNKYDPDFKIRREEKRFFINKPNAYGAEDVIPIKVITTSVTVITAFGDEVVFTKTNRAKSFQDSRTPKRNIDDDECLAELKRLLCSEIKALVAYSSLCGEY